MIIKTLAELLYDTITHLLFFINLPSGDGVFNTLSDYLDLMVTNGASIFEFFIPDFVFDVVVPFIMSIFVIKYSYYIILWIINKIPVLKGE